MPRPYCTGATRWAIMAGRTSVSAASSPGAAGRHLQTGTCRGHARTCASPLLRDIQAPKHCPHWATPQGSAAFLRLPRQVLVRHRRTRHPVSRGAACAWWLANCAGLVRFARVRVRARVRARARVVGERGGTWQASPPRSCSHAPAGMPLQPTLSHRPTHRLFCRPPPSLAFFLAPSIGGTTP